MPIFVCTLFEAHWRRFEPGIYVFTDLANATDYKDDKIRIRSIYSAASIKMFQGDMNYHYENSFEIINQIMYRDIKMKFGSLM